MDNDAELEKVICDCRTVHHITELGSICQKCGSPITLKSDENKATVNDLVEFAEHHYPSMMTLRGVSTEFLESIGFVKSPTTAMLRAPGDLVVQPMTSPMLLLPIRWKFDKPVA